jgi:hypothetical protein
MLSVRVACPAEKDRGCCREHSVATAPLQEVLIPGLPGNPRSPASLFRFLKGELPDDAPGAILAVQRVRTVIGSVPVCSLNTVLSTCCRGVADEESCGFIFPVVGR